MRAAGLGIPGIMAEWVLRVAAGVLIAVTWTAFAALRLVGRGAGYRAGRYATQID